MATGLPTSSVVEVELNAVWTDISAYVLQLGQVVSVREGRASEVDDFSPGTLSLTLDGIDGRFNPSSPTIVTAGVLGSNPYYPYFKEDIRIRVTLTKGASYVVFLGWITDILPSLAIEPTQSTVQVTATDTLGRLGRGEMLSLIQNEVKLDAPLAYYPLGEASTAVRCYDASTYARAPLVQADYYQTATAMVFGDPGPGAGDSQAVTFAFDSVGHGRRLTGVNLLAGISWSGVTIELWYKLNPSTSVGPFLLAGLHTGDLSQSGGTGSMLWVGTDFAASAAGVHAQSYQQNLTTAVNATSTTVVGDGLWHHAVLTCNGTTLLCYSDGIQVGTVGALALQAYTHLTVGAYGAKDFAQPAPATIAHVAVYNSVLSAGRIAAHYAAGNITAPTQTIATQTVALLSYIGQTGTYEAGFGPQVASPVPTAGRAPLDVLRTIVRGEGGTLYDNAAGLYFRARSAMRNATVKATFDVEADILGAPTLSRSTQNKVASATASSPAGSSTASDATAAAQVGSSVTAGIDTNLASLVELLSVASNRIGLGLSTTTRVAQVTVDLMTATNDLYATVLALKPGDRIRLSNIPQYMGVTYIDGYVLGWSWALSYDGFVWTFDITPADAPLEQVFDSLRFCTNGTSTLSSGITSSGTTVIIATASGPTFSTSAGDYPMDIDLNGERVTLTSVPGGGASPQTFTGVTRGVAPALARSHSGGEPVEVYDGIRFAF